MGTTTAPNLIRPKRKFNELVQGKGLRFCRVLSVIQRLPKSVTVTPLTTVGPGDAAQDSGNTGSYF